MRKHSRIIAVCAAFIMALSLFFGFPFDVSQEAAAFGELRADSVTILSQISPTERLISVYVYNVSKTFNHADPSIPYCGGTWDTDDKDVSHRQYFYGPDAEGYSGLLGNPVGKKQKDEPGECEKCFNPCTSIQEWDCIYSGIVKIGGDEEDEPSPGPSATPSANAGFISVQRITPTSYNNNTVGVASVTVKNTGEETRTRRVSFRGPRDNPQVQNVTLAPGASKTLDFNFFVPDPGPFDLTASADDTRTQPCNAAGIIPRPPGDSANEDLITWTEDDSHTVYYTVYDEEGEPSLRSYRCQHTFTYQARCTPSLTMTPSTLKSGYGFAVDAGASVATWPLSRTGCSSWGAGRPNTIIPAPPGTAEIRTNWTVVMVMKNGSRQTQQRNTPLDRVSGTGTASAFQAARSNISETGERKIYTDVALAGTGARPVQHPVTLWLDGGGISSRGLKFTFSKAWNITINGNMYQDDHTG